MHFPPAADGLPPVWRAASGTEMPDHALLPFGTAPDGLPRYLLVDRRFETERRLDAVRVACGVGDLAEVADGLEALLRAGLARRAARGRRLDLAGDGRSVPVYVSAALVAYLCGPTLMARMLTPDITVMVPRAPDDDRAAFPGSFGVTMPAGLGSRLRLAVDLAGGSISIAVVDAEDGPPRPLRRFIGELLLGLPGAMAWNAIDGSTAALDDAPGYAALLGRCGGRCGYRVPRAAVIRALVQVARRVGDDHARGALHGDLSPGNILVTAEGALPIDPLGLRSGDVATALTPRWAPPEQVLRRPLDPRADVFALGRMLVDVVGGLPTGEEATFVVAAGDAVERRSLLKVDAVVLPAQQGSPDGRRAWADFLGGAIDYDPARRPGDAASFADGLEALLAAHPIEGEIQMVGGFGTVATVDDGPVLAHVLVDA